MSTKRNQSLRNFSFATLGTCRTERTEIEVQSLVAAVAEVISSAQLFRQKQILEFKMNLAKLVVFCLLVSVVTACSANDDGSGSGSGVEPNPATSSRKKRHADIPTSAPAGSIKLAQFLTSLKPTDAEMAALTIELDAKGYAFEDLDMFYYSRQFTNVGPLGRVARCSPELYYDEYVCTVNDVLYMGERAINLNTSSNYKCTDHTLPNDAACTFGTIKFDTIFRHLKANLP